MSRYYWMVNLLLEAGAEVNAANAIRETPLHLAARDDKNLALARLLIQFGADINAKGLFDETALAVGSKIRGRVLSQRS